VEAQRGGERPCDASDVVRLLTLDVLMAVISLQGSGVIPLASA
jgi:hypothetical protein